MEHDPLPAAGTAHICEPHADIWPRTGKHITYALTVVVALSISVYSRRDRVTCKATGIGSMHLLKRTNLIIRTNNVIIGLVYLVI